MILQGLLYKVWSIDATSIYLICTNRMYWYSDAIRVDTQRIGNPYCNSPTILFIWPSVSWSTNNIPLLWPNQLLTLRKSEPLILFFGEYLSETAIATRLAELPMILPTPPTQAPTERAQANGPTSIPSSSTRKHTQLRLFQPSAGLWQMGSSLAQYHSYADREADM